MEEAKKEVATKATKKWQQRDDRKRSQTSYTASGR